MKHILMILTSHRLDCLKLNIDMLVNGGSIRRFDHVVLLCSGVEGKLRSWIEKLPALHPGIPWTFIQGPRGRGMPISNLQNECVRMFPEALYFKLDEDTFVSRDWDIKLTEAYERYRGDPRLALITPVVTNNQRGAYYLLTTFPELGDEFKRRFNKPIVTDRLGPVWHFPKCAEFMIRRFLDLDAANQELSARNQEPFSTFSYPFSINCLCYDYRHWREIGGVPEFDENGWGEWIPLNNKFIVLAQHALVHHYSFFVQQDWMDRSSLLEDIRSTNVPGTSSRVAGNIARAKRIALQIPKVIARRVLRRGDDRPET